MLCDINDTNKYGSVEGDGIGNELEGRKLHSVDDQVEKDVEIKTEDKSNRRETRRMQHTRRLW